MIENIFKSELSAINIKPVHIGQLWIEIEACYSTPKRHYHNLAHLNQMIAELLPVKEKITDWQTIIFSIIYHDIIYNPLRQDNEEKSAGFANKRLDELQIPEVQKTKCSNQILATKKHLISNDQDTNYLIDADLSILGSDTDRFLKYTQQIRKEYRYYPDLIYNPGRKKVLRHFLEMQNIFKTTYFQDKYEKKARANIAAELDMLS